MEKIITFIKQIQYNNRKMKLSVLSSSLVFYLILAIIPFIQIIEYVLNKTKLLNNMVFYPSMFYTIFLIVYLIWISSKFLHIIHQISDIIYYNIEERSHFKVRIKSFIYMIIILLITLMLIVFTIYLSYVKNNIQANIIFIIEITQVFIPIIWIILLFMFLYKKIIPVKIKWSQTIRVGSITGLLIYISIRLYEQIVEVYLKNKYLTVYGRYASLVSLLVWLYFSCYIFLSGMAYLFIKNTYKNNKLA